VTAESGWNDGRGKKETAKYFVKTTDQTTGLASGTMNSGRICGSVK
jgi:hypothetical protein